MRAECVQAVTDAAKAMGLSKPPRINDIETAIRDNLKQAAREDREAFNAMPIDERYKMAGEKAVKDAQHAAIRKRMLADIEIQAAAKREIAFNEMTSRGLTGVEAVHRMFNFVADGRGNRQSIESMSNAQAAIFKSKLDKLFQYEKDGTALLGLMTDKKFGEDFIREAKGQDSGNPQAKQAYKNFSDINNEMIDLLNRVGGDVSKRADWSLPQYLSQYKLSKMTVDEYVKNWMEFVKRDEYVNPDGSLMSDAQMAKFLEESYYTQLTGGAGKQPGEGNGASAIANRRQERRQLHYKSPEAYAKAMELAGEGNVYEQIQRHIDSISRDITFIEKVGPNADLAFHSMLAKAIDLDVRNAGKYDESYVNTIKTAWAQSTGAWSDNLSVAERHVLNETKSTFVASKLGGMILAQIGDLTSIVSVSRAMQIPLSSVMANAVKYASSPEFRSAAKSMGYALESVAHSVSRLGDAASSYGTMSKVAALSVRLQGSNAWNDLWSGALGTAMAAQTSQLNMKYKTLADLPEWDRHVLESKGVTEQDWALWQKAGRDTYGMFSHQAINDIPLEEVKKIAPEIGQTIREANDSVIQGLLARSEKESEWVAGREAKLDDYRKKIEGMIASTEKTFSKNRDAADSYKQYLSAMLDHAAAKHEMLKAASTAKSMDDVRGLLADFAFAEKEGTLQAKSFEQGGVDWTAALAVTKGDTLGRRLGKTVAFAEQQMRNADAKIKALDKAEMGRIAGFIQRVDKASADFAQFSKATAERMESRQSIIDEMNSKVESKIDEAAMDYLRNSSLKFVSMTLEETHMAVLSPSATTKAEMAKVFGSGYGTLLTQFKTFPWAFYRQHFIDRANFYGEHGGSPLQYKLQLSALATVFGGISLLVGDIASGRDPRDLSSKEKAAEFGLNAFLRGGGLGVFNDLIEVMRSDYNAGDIGRLAGPAVSVGVDILNVAGSAGKMALHTGDSAEKAKRDLPKDVYKLAVSNTPFQNFWPTKAFVHGVLLHDIQELANPGYMDRAKERAEKNYGSKYFIGYGEEPRMPNLSNIAGQ